MPAQPWPKPRRYDLATILNVDASRDGFGSGISSMNPQEAVDAFRDLLLEDFHYGHQRAQVDRAYKQVCEKLNAPVTGMGEHLSEMRYNVLALRQRLMEIVETYDPTEPFLPDGNLRVMNDLMATLSPYLRSPEPVSVSLEQIARKVQKHAQEVGDDSPVDYGDAEGLTKVVLKAAGVNYVD